MFRYLKIVLLTTVVAMPVHAQSLSLDEVLAKLVETYGGEHNLGKTGQMVQEWSVEALSRNTEGTDVRHIQEPGRLKVELTYPHRKEARVLNGSKGYMIFNDGTPVEATGPQRDAMRLQLMRFYSPLALRERVKDLSLAEEGGYYFVTLEENGLRAGYVVNPENWHIEKVVGVLTMMGRQMSFLTEYSDFAVVDGVLMHHSENKFAGGVNTARLTLTKVTFGATIDDKVFQPEITSAP